MLAKKNRRGSTLVFVALMLVAIAGVGAIAADIGRFYVVTGELQTSADAAALAGAKALQNSSASNLDAAVDAVTTAFVASTNRSDGSNLTIPNDSSKTGFWTPPDPSNNKPGRFDSPAPLGTTPNAVYVAVSNAPRGVFSQIIGRRGTLPLTRRAIAWIGNVSLNCVRPFALPYSPLYKRIVPGATPGPSGTYPDINDSAYAAFQNTSVANRTVIVLGEGESAAPGLANDGYWMPYNLPDGSSANASQNTFEAEIATCGKIALNGDAGAGKTVPAVGGGAAKKCGAQYKVTCGMIDMMQPPNSAQNCAAFRGSLADCYASATAQSPGVVIQIAWGDFTGVGAGTVDFRYVAEFQLMCVFGAVPNQTCSFLNNASAKYPPGTIVGVALGLRSRFLTPADIVSNSPSNVQRLFLVK